MACSWRCVDTNEQYELQFSNDYILQDDALARLTSFPLIPTPSKAASSSISSKAQPAELSNPSSSDSRNSFKDASQDASQPPPTYERLILSSRPYLCTIPTIAPQENATKNATTSAADEATELARAATRGWELLKDMEGNCMYFFSGWWSYSFCYNTNVKQFHQLPPGKGAPTYPPVEDPATPSYVLGKFPAPPPKESQAKARLDGPAPARREELSSSKNAVQKPTKANIPKLKSRGAVRYLSQTLSGGTTCDLTGRDRRVEVQFHCHPQSGDRIGWIKEVSTCAYLMVIYTPRLCNEVAFLPNKGEKAHQISCAEILDDESEVKDWRRRKRQEMERRNSQQKTLGEHGRPMVGTIEVGGQRLVGGTPERTITPPATGGHPGNPQTQIYTIIRRGRRTDKAPGKIQKMNQKTMEKLGLDVKAVEQAGLAVDKAAEGKGWELKGWEGEGGSWELRGLIEGEAGPGDEAVEWDLVVEEEGSGGSGGGDQQSSTDDAQQEDGSGDEEPGGEDVGSKEEMVRDEL